MRKSPSRPLRSLRVAALLAIALSAVTFACRDQRLPTSSLLRPSARPAADESTGWPNEPTGFAVISDYAFNDAIPSGADVAIGQSGWRINNANGYVTQATNAADAPYSPPDVGQWSFPVGLQGGSAPGNMYIDPGYTKATYFGVWWKVSSPFQDPSSGYQELLTIRSDSGMIVLEMAATGTTPPHRLDVQTEFNGITQLHLTPNINADDPTLGTWHRLEWHLQYSTSPTSNDGIVEWWMDGRLQGQYSNVNMPADAGFGEYQIAPRWDGSTNETEQDYMWFDHARVSKVATVQWPNEPTGMTLVSDYAFNDALPTGHGVSVGSSGWKINNEGEGGCNGPTGTLASQLTNRTDSPLSPPNVGQWSYPIGFKAGCAPATMYIDAPAFSKEVYFGMWWQPSNPWQNESNSGVNKIAFIFSDSGSVILDMHNTGSNPPYDIRAFVEMSTGSLPLEPTASPPANVTLGVWHHLEWYVKYSTTSTSADGIVRWWMDGALQGEYTNQNFPHGDRGFYEYQLSPTWGGGNNTKTEQDYYWYDHLHISRR